MTGTAINITFATGTDTLNLTSGGLIGPNNNNTIGATVDSGRLTAGGLTPAASSDLYVFNRANVLTINSRIINNVNGGGSVVRAVFTASGGTITLVNPNNNYTGGTVVNGGTLNLTNTVASAVIPAAASAAKGLIINGGTVTENNFNNQIAAANEVTLNGNAALNLFGNNTLAGLVIDDNGGGASAPTVTSFIAASVTGGTGVLTLGANGISVTPLNPATVSAINGRLDLGASASTIFVDSYNFDGFTDFAPTTAGVTLQGVVGSAGGFAKTGNGLLQFNAQAVFTGPIDVSAGGIRIGIANGGSRFSALTLNAGTRLDLAGFADTIGSLAGSGTVTDTGAAATLTVGFDNTNTTFSGLFKRFNDATLAAIPLTKIGTGTLTLTGAEVATSGSTGIITIDGGSITFKDSGQWFASTTAQATTFTLNPGGTLALDNTGTMNVNNRLGLNAAGTFNLQGGELTINGTSAASTPTVETIATFNVLNGGGRMDLTPNAANPLTVAIGTLNSANGSGALVIGGITGAASANGVANVTITTPAVLGTQGGTGNGTSTMSVRQDILADPTIGGLGTGFAVKDSVTGNYRALGTASNGSAAPGELSSALLPSTTTQAEQNVGLSTTQTITANSVANTLTISGTGIVNSGLPAAFGNYGPGGGLLTLSLSNAAASLTLAGATGTINVGDFGSTTAGTTAYVHVIAGGALTINGAFGLADTSGILKADNGALTLGGSAYYTGTTTVDGGTLNLSSGVDNTLVVAPGGTAPTVSALTLNGPGAIVDLKPKNQIVGALSSTKILPGEGGAVTGEGTITAGVSTVTLTSTAAGNFAGAINGTINFTRAGTGTTLLTSASGYSGDTIVRGSTLQLRDSGSILNTTSINLQYGTLQIDQSGLNPLGNLNPTRVAAATPITMQGGSLILTAGGSMDSAATFNSVTLTGGANTIQPTVLASQGSTNTITIGNLTTTALVTAGGTLNFNAAIGQPGINQAEVLLTKVNNSTPTNATTFGPNIIVNSGDYGEYLNATQGVGALGSTGFAAYGAALASGASTPTVINFNTAALTISANTTTGSLKFGTAATTAMTFSAGTEIVDLALGGLLSANNNNAVSIGTAALRGFLTAGTTSAAADLVTYQSQNTTTLESIIENNTASGVVRLIKSGVGTLTLTAPNLYTGGTVVDQGTLNLTTLTPGNVVIPTGPVGAGLVITNATVTQNTNNQQIATTTDVVINGNGQLNLTTGANTLNSLSWNNSGGTGNPTVNGGTGLLTLSSGTPITAINDNLANAPILSGAGGLALSNATPVITVSGLSPNDLQISAAITSAGGPITKSGVGGLDLTGASTFTNGVNLSVGTLLIGANSTPTTGTVTSGPLGTGTLTISGGTTLESDGTARTIANAITASGDFTIGGVLTGNGITLNGAINLGATNRTITVNSPAETLTIGGALTSGAASATGLTKAGPGTMIISAVQTDTTFGGVGTGAGIVVSGGMLKNGVTNALANDSLLTINSGAGYDLNGFSEAIQQIGGTGFITNSATTAQTLTLAGTGATDISTSLSYTFSGIITDNHAVNTASTLAVTKAGIGTLTLGTVGNNYCGATTIVAGSLTGSADNTLSPNSSVIVGNSTTAALTSTLDLTAGGGTNTNQIIGGLQATDGNATGAASIIIATGKTLTVNGPVTLGSNAGTTDTTNVNFTGGGNLVVNSTGGTFQIGGALLLNADSAIVNMSSLANFTANMGSAGTFRLGDNNSTNAGAIGVGASVLTLAGTSNTISAGPVAIGDLEQVRAAPLTLHLGAGTNAINANTINISSTTTGRANGTLNFAGGTGTITIRDFNGDATTASSTAVFNLINGNDGTGAAMTATVDFTGGHTADVVVSAINQSARSAGTTGGATSTFSFDTGSVAATTVALSARTGTSATTAVDTSTMNIGGTANATFGTVNMAVNSVNVATTTGASTATLNINGTGTTAITTLNMASDTVAGTGSNGASSGTVNIGTTSGAPTVGLGTVTMAVDTSTGVAASTATAALNIAAGTVTATSINMTNAVSTGIAKIATSTISLTGGSLTLAGNITRTGGTGTENTTLTLNGGLLNLTGHNIGATGSGVIGSGSGALNLLVRHDRERGANQRRRGDQQDDGGHADCRRDQRLDWPDERHRRDAAAQWRRLSDPRRHGRRRERCHQRPQRQREYHDWHGQCRQHFDRSGQHVQLAGWRDQ